MPTFGFTDNDGIDVGNKYVTKDYIMEIYPDLLPSMIAPQLLTVGSNANGELGNDSTTARSSPGSTAATTGAWKQVGGTSGGTVTAIKTDGTLWTWGAGSSGQLGDGTTVNKSSPVTTAGGGTNWAQAAAADHCAAIKTDGTLWTWGSNLLGRLGDGTTTNRSSPGTTAGGGTNWRQVSCSSATAAVKTDGTLWTWGGNTNGLLGSGDADATSRSSPGTTAGGGTNWKQVSIRGHAAAIKADGTLWAWGNNATGQLGDNSITNRNSPVTTAGGGTNWRQVSCGTNHTAAIKTDGTLWTWGTNTSGELGDGTTTSRRSPVTSAGGGTNWSRTSAGSSNSVAIKTDGTLWTWGDNGSGQLSTGNTTGRSSPGTTLLGGNSWKFVHAVSANQFLISEIGDW